MRTYTLKYIVNTLNCIETVYSKKSNSYVYVGHLIGRRGIGDHRVTESFFQDVFHVSADSRLTGSELDEYIERMYVGDRTREMKFAFHARHDRVVHEFERR